MAKRPGGGRGAAVVREGAVTAGRVMLALVFIFSGWHMLADPGGALERMQAAGVSLSTHAAAVSWGVLMAAGGLLLLAGWLTRGTAVVLFVFTGLAAVFMHLMPAWREAGEAARVALQIRFFEDVAIMGGLALLYAAGPGRISADVRLGKRG